MSYRNTSSVPRPLEERPYAKSCDRVDPETGEVLPGRTRQEFKDEADIRKMLDRFTATGRVELAAGDPKYLDLSSVPDYHQACSTVARVNQAFAELPAELRDRHGNDPVQFLEALQRLEEAELELGREGASSQLEAEPGGKESEDSAETESGGSLPPAGGSPAS